MGNLTWKYIKPLKNEKSIELVEKRYNIELPNDLIYYIKNTNGGRPSSKVFDTNKAQERMIKTLLSYNEDDIENVYKVLSMFKEEEIKLIPFASDPSGNYICIDVNNNDSVVFWNHEINNTEYIAKNFSAFLNKLYE